MAVLRGSYPRPLSRDLATSRAVLERRVIHIPDVQADREYSHPLARDFGVRTALAVPMLREGVPIGGIAVWRDEVRPFTDNQLALLQTFADQAVIAIENVRLFKELQEKNEALTTAHAQVSEALNQQTATSEILRVISQSQTDVQPVFDAIVQSAVDLCKGFFGIVTRYDGHVSSVVAKHKIPTEALELLQTVHNLPESLTSQALVSRAVVHVHDVMRAPELSAAAKIVGYRTAISVPLLSDGQPIGTINVARRESLPFSDTEINLLKTFADQAVIAIENVRLFNETKEALEQQTATSEILRVISQSPTDVQPVFDAIVRSASQLCGGEYAIVTRYDGQLLHLAAQYNPRPGTAAETARFFPQAPHREALTPRAFVDAHLVHAPDIDAEDVEPSTRE